MLSRSPLSSCVRLDHDTASVPQFIEMIEAATGKQAVKHSMSAHAAELPETYADVSHAAEELDYSPQMSTNDGVVAFVEWFKWYSEQGMFRPFPRADYYFPGGPAEREYNQRRQQQQEQEQV